VSNFLLAGLFLMLARILYSFPSIGIGENGLDLVDLLIYWSALNIGLFLFNLIPLPPLDGSHLYTTYLHDINPRLLLRIYQYGTAALLIIILVQNNTHVTIIPISPVIEIILKWMIGVMGFGGR
jgi:Zn-dependent protease